MWTLSSKPGKIHNSLFFLLSYSISLWLKVMAMIHLFYFKVLTERK